MKQTMICTTLAVTLMAFAGCAKKEKAPEVAAAPASVQETPAAVESSASASATLQSRGDTTAHGQVTFTQMGDEVTVVAHIEGAAPGSHGFHLHQTGDCSAADFKSTGGHFNPADVPHGGPADEMRHAGDFGNIEVGEDGTAHLELVSSLITVLPGPNSVAGRGVILHEKADDLESQPTGAAGSRVACGVVEVEG